MKNFHTAGCIILCLAYAVCPNATAILKAGENTEAARRGSLQATFDDHGVLVSEGDQPILYYQRTAKSLDGKWTRANYLHPVYDLQGEVITEDFPADHGHHRGIFWAWHQVWLGDRMLGDPWICDDFRWEVQSVAAHTPGDPLTLVADVVWKSPAYSDNRGKPIPIAEEQVTVTVHPTGPGYRVIDFEIALQALVSEVRIGGSDDVKGYGGFSPRIRLDDTQTFFSPGGEVEPMTEAMEAPRWIDIAGDRYGFAMITHPGNPRTTEQDRWILRRRRSMQNAVYPGREPVELSAESPTVLRYRIVVHDGELAHETIANLSNEFAAR